MKRNYQTSLAIFTLIFILCGHARAQKIVLLSDRISDATANSLICQYKVFESNHPLHQNPPTIGVSHSNFNWQSFKRWYDSIYTSCYTHSNPADVCGLDAPIVPAHQGIRIYFVRYGASENGLLIRPTYKGRDIGHIYQHGVEVWPYSAYDGTGEIKGIDAVNLQQSFAIFNHGHPLNSNLNISDLTKSVYHNFEDLKEWYDDVFDHCSSRPSDCPYYLPGHDHLKGFRIQLARNLDEHPTNLTGITCVIMPTFDGHKIGPFPGEGANNVPYTNYDLGDPCPPRCDISNTHVDYKGGDYNNQGNMHRVVR